MKPAQKHTKSAKSNTASGKNPKVFSDEERAAIRDRVEEMKAREHEGDSIVLGKIAEMQEPDRTTAKRLHALIRQNVPALTPRLWYGMPAYAKDDKVVCFFQPATKFKTRYSTFGFSDKANLDDGNMWPNAYALMELTSTEEARIAALVKKAAG